MMQPEAVPFSPVVPSAAITGNISGNISTHAPSSVRTPDSTQNPSNVAETTLDEPVIETVKRDFQMVLTKMKKVVIPSADTKDELRNWDLWGPLFLCLILAILLSIDESDHTSTQEAQSRPAVVFSSLLLIVWCGAIVVTVNAKLLGGNVSFFQNICLLGYCVAPMIAATAVCMVVRISLPDMYYSCGPGPHTLCEGGVCMDAANITINVGDKCTGWTDQDTCLGDGRCNSVHSNAVNIILRLLITGGGMFWSLRSSLGFLSEVVEEKRRALAAYPVCLFFAAIAWMVLLRTSSA
mmetsp:Transcript_45482/g.91062  ORF Transcript_45482/g.91062 Transcript_45482/m.91062 type:complete len:295 (+) Transcript_45482:52-936(+)